MGNRSSIAVKGNGGQVFLYGHWMGSRHVDILQRALVKSIERWTDSDYLAGVIFNEMTEQLVNSCAISASLGDNQYPVLTIDCVTQKVSMKGSVQNEYVDMTLPIAEYVKDTIKFKKALGIKFYEHRQNFAKVKEREQWPKRYSVHAIAKKYPRRDCLYKDVYITLFQSDMKKGEIRGLLNSIGLTDCDPYLCSQVEETFTKEQAEQLKAYLEAFPETEAFIETAKKPSEGWMGVSAIPIGGCTGFYMFSKSEGYTLDFKVYGYYDIRHNEYEVCIA